MVALTLVLLGGGVLLWTWALYPAAVRVLAEGTREGPEPEGEAVSLSVSVILPVHNAASALRDRLPGLLEVVECRQGVEVLLALDGCTDETVAVADGAMAPDRALRVVILPERGGKSVAQNEAVEVAQGDVLVLNDVGSEFTLADLDALVAPFADERVGFVAGNLGWRPEPASSLVAAGAAYTSWERSLWRDEARLGLLHVAPGGFMAVRASLFRALAPDVGDDAMIPLDVLGQGKVGAFAPEARAVDSFSGTHRQELRSRARMTSRSLRATLRGLRRGRLWRRPALLVALVSHRILRWLTPLFLLLLLGGLLMAAPPALSSLPPGQAMGLGAALALLVVLSAALPSGRRVWKAGWAFLVANAGFLLGMIHYLSGGVIRAYGEGESR